MSSCVLFVTLSAACVPLQIAEMGVSAVSLYMQKRTSTQIEIMGCVGAPVIPGDNALAVMDPERKRAMLKSVRDYREACPDE